MMVDVYSPSLWSLMNVLNHYPAQAYLSFNCLLLQGPFPQENIGWMICFPFLNNIKRKFSISTVLINLTRIRQVHVVTLLAKAQLDFTRHGNDTVGLLTCSFLATLVLSRARAHNERLLAQHFQHLIKQLHCNLIIKKSFFPFPFLWLF